MQISVFSSSEIKKMEVLAITPKMVKVKNGNDTFYMFHDEYNLVITSKENRLFMPVGIQINPEAKGITALRALTFAPRKKQKKEQKH